MTFYEYRQNNSGGVFEIEEGKFSVYNWIEANSGSQADDKAVGLGIYFDDDYEIDCDCCGTRWNSNEGSAGYTKEEFEKDLKSQIEWNKKNNGVSFYDIRLKGMPYGYIHYADGTVEAINLPTKEN